MKQYLDLLKQVRDNGVVTNDRTGVGRKRIFGAMLRFNLQDGFPLVTTKKINTKNIIEELLWFIRGSQNANELSDGGVNIWDDWKVTSEHIEPFFAKYHQDIEGLEKQHLMKEDNNHFNGLVGPIYGPVWRNASCEQHHSEDCNHRFEDIAPDKLVIMKKLYEEYIDNIRDLNKELQDADKPPIERVKSFEGFAVEYSYNDVDQLQDVLVNLKKTPFSSRHVINTWIPGNIPYENLSPQENVLLGKGALAPCHVMQQYFVIPNDGKLLLSLKLDLRSSDIPIGLPYNIAQYAMLLAMVAQVSGMIPNELIVSIGDAHIYTNQLDIVNEQLSRECYQLPSLKINPDIMDLYQFNSSDIHVEDYQHHLFIQYPLAA